MCMITFVPAHVELPLDGIRQGSKRNRDGHGWALASKNGLFIGKSMDFEESLDLLVKTRYREGLDSIVMFHSRFGTHGVMGEFNIHPFYVGEDNLTVMSHNGVLPHQFHPLGEDPRSDTRVFADQIQSYVDTKRGVPSRRGGQDLGRLIGSNKLVFLSVKSGEPKARIVNAYLGEWDGGVWYSNTGYQKPKYASHSYSSAWSDYSGEWKKDEATGIWSKGGGKSGVLTPKSAGGTAGGTPTAGVSQYAGESSAGWDAVDAWWTERGIEERNAAKHNFCCPRCFEDKDVDWIGMFCPTCYYCIDCDSDMGDCMCYIPSHKGEGAKEDDVVEGEVVSDLIGTEGNSLFDVPFSSPSSCETSCDPLPVAPQEGLSNYFEGIVNKMTEREKDAWMLEAEEQGRADVSPIAAEIRRQAALQREPLALESGELKAIG